MGVNGFFTADYLKVKIGPLYLMKLHAKVVVGRFAPLFRQHATESALSKRRSTLGLLATS